MTKILPTAALFAVAAVATPASAQERDSHFNGFYAGVSVGMANSSSDGDADPVQFDTNRDAEFTDQVTLPGGTNLFAPGFCPGAGAGTSYSTCAGDDDGIEYAGRLGYDIRMGNMVAGALIEASKAELTDFASAYSTTPGGYHLGRELDFAVSARARLGFTPGGGALFYVTGGGSYARLNHSFSTTNTVNRFTPAQNDEMVWGWQAGGGAEVMLGDKLSLGLEYLYNRYDDDKYYVNVASATPPVTGPFPLSGGTTYLRQDPRFDFHALRATVNLQF